LSWSTRTSIAGFRERTFNAKRCFLGTQMRKRTETSLVLTPAQAALIRRRLTPHINTGLRSQAGPFLVVVLDRTPNWCMDLVVRAPDEDAAARKAIQRRKADHDITAPYGDGGFTAIAIFSRQELARILKTMELPEPEV